MEEEIEQVKASVNEIFDTVMNHNESQIKDVILITFNDYEKPVLRTITKDRNEFKKALSFIEIHGGGDCPELSMSGIIQGIIHSKPGSTIYVVTDAAAKDYTQYDEVKNLAISKQIQIVFLLTGICEGTETSPSYLVYHSLADDTEGQVFNLTKQDISEILRYIINNIEGSRVTLANVKLPPGTNSVEVKFDVFHKNVTVAVTGVKPKLNTTGPDGKAHTEPLIRLDNVIIDKIIDPKPAVYNFTVSSPSETHVLVSAQTDIKFRYGFSYSKPSSIGDAVVVPNPDYLTHVIIKLTNGSVELKTVKILGMDNKLIKEIPLTAINKIEKLYATGLEELPEIMFKIAITGYDPKSGETIIRIGPPVKPPARPKHAPVVTIVGSLIPNQLQLTCTVTAYPKPNIVWINGDGDELPATTSAVKLPNDFVSTLVIDRVHTTGNYQCKADNSDGYISTSYSLKSIPHVFTILKKPKDISINYVGEGELHCEVDAYPPATVTWFKDAKLLMANDNIEISTDNSTLKIKEMHSYLGGTYLCEIRNEYNRKIVSAKVTITGVERPSISRRTKAKTILIGADTVISCKINRGFPKPTITWFFTNDSSGETFTLDEWNDRENITIRNADETKAGVYSCLAKNEVGNDYLDVTLTVQYPPKIEQNDKHVIVKEGNSILMPCNVKGKPDPKVTWYKDNVILTNRKNLYIYKDHSIRMSVGLKDSGVYTCNATNTHGTASRTVIIKVYAPATITLPENSKLEVNVGTAHDLPCQAKGYPRLITQWVHYSFDPSVPPKRVLTSLGPSVVQLKNIQVGDEGYYTCIASNLGGKTNVTYEVHVNAHPIIEQTYMNKNFKAVEGDLVMIIKCNASGNPPPIIRWMKNGYWVATGDDFSIEKGTLIMKNINQDAAGYYMCEAKNPVGFQRELYHVTVDKSPQTGPPTSNVTIMEGGSSAVQCDVSHKNTDVLRWYKNGVLIHMGELVITNAKLADSGLYTCRVSDFASSASGNTLVKVGYKPMFVSEEEETIEYVEGMPLLLSCEASGDPEPKVKWWHNGEIMNSTKYYHYFEMEVGTHGQYKCEASNDFGTITRSFNIITTDCIIDIKKQPSKLQPLMLSSRYKWPQHVVKNGYMSISKNQYVNLFCPNSFKDFPQKKVWAACKGGSEFIIKYQTYEYSKIECTEKVTHIIEGTGESCFTGNTELRSVVFDVSNHHNIAYDVCYDQDNNMPVYTMMHMSSSVADVSNSEAEWPNDNVSVINLDEVYKCNHQNGVTSTILQRWFHTDDQCCFGRRMLVSPQDLFPGVAQTAAYSDFNVVPHWSTCNAEFNNWNEVEQRVRTLAKATYSELRVYSGVAENLTLRDSYGSNKTIYVVDNDKRGQNVPEYLWKVVQEPATRSSLVIIQVNVPDLKASEALAYVRCHDICNSTKWMKGSTWHDVRRGFTYCCTLKDFENNFGFSGVFEPYYQNLSDVSLIPEHSLT